MPEPNPEALRFLRTRRSRPAKTLRAPAPDRAAVMELLTIAARSPDHGKLEPWRFIVLGRGALDRFAGLVRAHGARLGKSERDIDKQVSAYADSPLAVVVVSAPKPSDEVPEIEQRLSAGAVCLSLLNAALACGWGANWLTGWPVHDAGFRAEALGLEGAERVTGVIHIGTETRTPPERPRPDVAALTSWLEA